MRGGDNGLRGLAVDRSGLFEVRLGSLGLGRVVIGLVERGVLGGWLVRLAAPDRAWLAWPGLLGVSADRVSKVSLLADWRCSRSGNVRRWLGRSKGRRLEVDLVGVASLEGE